MAGGWIYKSVHRFITQIYKSLQNAIDTRQYSSKCQILPDGLGEILRNSEKFFARCKPDRNPTGKGNFISYWSQGLTGATINRRVLRLNPATNKKLSLPVSGLWTGAKVQSVTPIKVLRRGFTLGGARFGRHLLKFLRL